MISGGGAATDAVVNARGSEWVFDYGVTSGAQLDGGLNVVLPGAIASGTIINQGGAEFVFNGGTTGDTVPA